MRVYKKKTIRRMKWYGVILVLSGIPLGIGMGRSLEEGRTFLLEESQTYAQKLYLPLFLYQKEQESEREGDLQASTSCVDAVGRISGRSDRKKGKERTGGSVGR